jgi:hypothetical protein
MSCVGARCLRERPSLHGATGAGYSKGIVRSTRMLILLLSSVWVLAPEVWELAPGVWVLALGV